MPAGNCLFRTLGLYKKLLSEFHSVLNTKSQELELKSILFYFQRMAFPTPSPKKSPERKSRMMKTATEATKEMPKQKPLVLKKGIISPTQIQKMTTTTMRANIKRKKIKRP